MGQKNSRRTSECTCGCGTWDRGSLLDSPSSIHRYVSAVTDRWSGRECNCRRRRWRRTACVCTGYRRIDDTISPEDRGFATLLRVGVRELRRELEALVENRDADVDNITETDVYVFSLHRSPEQESFEELESRVGADVARAAENALRLHPHFQFLYNGDMRTLFIRPAPAVGPATGSNADTPAKIHTQVDYIHCLVPDLQKITACSFYWGKMDRYEAERLLDNKPEGTFLLRDSAQEEYLFSVSFRKYGRSLHARIEHHRRLFSFDSHDPAVFAAPTVTGLIEHYKDPACVMFFEPMLSVPLVRTEPFSLLQLARATLVSRLTYDDVEKLPLPSRIRTYLKEYHYRQRVRVRRFEPDLTQTHEDIEY